MRRNWWQSLFFRSRKPIRIRRHSLERLEDRTTPAVTAMLAANVLVVNLDAAGDEARLGVNGADYEIRDGANTLIFNTPIAGVNSTTFTGNLAGNQTVVWNDTVSLPQSAAVTGVTTLTVNGSYTFGTTLSVVLGGAGAGGISDGATGQLIVGGTTTLTAGANPIELDNNNDFQSAVSVVAASSVALTDANNLPVAAIVSTGPVTLTADNIDITAAINVGANTVTLQPLTALRAVDLGGPDSATALGLTDAELDFVTAGVLQIGNATTGQVDNTAAITQAGSGYTTLSITSASSIVNAGGSIAGTNLALRAPTGIGTAATPLATAVANLEAESDTAGIFIANTGNLAIGGVDAALNGVRVTGATGEIAISSLGSISIAVGGDNVAGPEAITLTATGATADLSTGSGNVAPNRAVNAGGAVNLTAGRDLLLGGPLATDFGDVTGTDITLIAGRNIVLDADTLVDANGNIVATAGQDITLTALTGGSGPRFTTGGGTIALTAGGVLTLTAAAATAAVISNGGDITFTADAMTIDRAVDAGAGCVILQPLTAGTPIDLGTETAGSLSITNTEINQITAGVIRVGSTSAGAITVSQPINLTTSPNLALRSGAAIAEGAAGTLTVTNLGVEAGATATLNNANAVGQLAATAPGGFSFMNGAALTIGSVDVCDPALLAGVTTTNTAINITINGAGNLLTINTPVNAGNAAVTLIADDMAINAAVSAGTNTATLSPFTANRPISLGANFAGSLGLTDAELDQVTAGLVQIGSATAGDVTIRGAISPAGTSTLRIQTAGAIIDANAGGPDITVANLALIAGTGIGSADPIETAVTNLAFTNGTNGVQIANAGSLTFMAVAGVATSTSASAAAISAAGGITFAVNVTATGSLSATASETLPPAANVSNLVVNGGVTVRSTTGDVTLSAGDRQTLNGTLQALGITRINSGFGDNDGDGSQTLNGPVIGTTIILDVGGQGGVSQTGGTVNAAGLFLFGTGANGSFTLTQAGNDVGTIAATTNADINYRDANTLTVGLVAGVNGINTGGNDLTITTAGLLALGDGGGTPQQITAAGAIVDFNSAGVTQNANGPVVAGSLRLRGTGTFSMFNTGNDVVTFAADTTGAIALRDGNALTIGTVLGTVGVRVQGINANVDALTLFVGSNLTIAQVIDTGGIGGGNITANIGQSIPGTLTQNVELSARRATFIGGDAVTSQGIGDTFLIRPSATTPIFIEGNLPTTPVGDSLRLFLNQGEQGLQFNPGVPGAGTFTFTNRATIDFIEIETLNQLNLLAFVLQTGPMNFTIAAQGRIEQQVTGTVPLVAIPSNPFVVAPQLVDPLQPFGAPRMAVGDVNGDGIPDLIVSFGPNNGPLVTIFDGADVFRAAASPRILSQFFAYDPRFFGGVFVAAADFNGDGRAEIVTGPDAGGGPHVRVLRFDPNVADINRNVGDYPGPLGNFFPFSPSFTGGVRVATGDVTGDGRADLITAAGFGGGPHIRVFDGVSGDQIAGPLGSFFAYETTFTGGVFVAAGDYNGDGRSDVMTGPGVGGAARVRIFSGIDGAVLADFNAFPPPGPDFPFPPLPPGGNTLFPTDAQAFNGVGGLAFADLDGDNILDILVGSGRGQAARMRAFRGNRMTPTALISDYVDAQFRDGFNVASFIDPQFGV